MTDFNSKPYAALTFKTTLLGSLYVSQYIPFAFFYQAFPVYLRQQQISLKAIGLLSLLALPWMLKFLWSPLIDRYGVTTWGHYRFWILCFQGLLGITLVTCAFLDIQRDFSILLIATLLLVLFAASQDIATDALAVQLLNTQERGWGNGIQAAGGYLGAILGGGVTLILLNRLGWTASLLVLAVCILLSAIPVSRYQEPMVNQTVQKPNFAALIHFVCRPGMWRWMIVLLLYMAATTMANVMFKPLLVDLSLSLEQIGLLTGVVGFGASLVGALIAGLLITPLGRRRSLVLFGILQSLLIAGYLLPAVGIRNLPLLYLICIAVQIITGMAYTITYTIMMDRSEPRTAGTDYTLQTSILYFGGIVASVFSGFIAQTFGYVGLFISCIVVGLISIVIVTRYLDIKGVPISRIRAVN